MTRLEKLRELRARIDQEITREIACQRRLGKIEAEVTITARDPEQMAGVLIGASAEHFHVSVEALVGPTRKHRAIAARQVAAWVLRTSLGLSYPEIGRLIGKDHTTAMYACKRVEADPRLRVVGAHLIREAA